MRRFDAGLRFENPIISITSSNGFPIYSGRGHSQVSKIGFVRRILVPLDSAQESTEHSVGRLQQFPFGFSRNFPQRIFIPSYAPDTKFRRFLVKQKALKDTLIDKRVVISRHSWF